MKTQLKKLKPIFIIFASLLVIMIFFKYSLKISYSSFSDACNYILLISSCSSFISLMYFNQKLLFNSLITGGCLLTNLLFIHFFYNSYWDLNLLNNTKWIIVLAEVPFAILVLAKRRYKRANKKDLQIA